MRFIKIDFLDSKADVWVNIKHITTLFNVNDRYFISVMNKNEAGEVSKEQYDLVFEQLETK